MSEVELLQTTEAVVDELQRRDVVRTRDKPIAGYTEWLVRGRMGLTEAAKGQKGFDATDKNGIRYQIKGRRDEGTSVQFGTIRNLDERPFHFVIAVAFNDNYSIRFAVKIPYETVCKLAGQTVNGPALRLTDKILEEPGVKNIRKFLV